MQTRQLCLIVSLAVMLLGAVLAAAPASYAASGSVSPRQGQVGTRFHFNASGFTPGERVDSWVTWPNSRTLPRYPSVFADSAGAIVWSWDVPNDALAGTYTMVARGIRSGEQAVILFEVTAAGNPAPPLAGVTPASGGAGTTFTFTADGFQANERVDGWLNQPDDRNRDLVPGKDPGIVADAGGRATWSWTAPGGVLPGSWRAVARGVRSGAQVIISFEITGAAPAAPVRSVTPASGGPGTTFTVTAGGFRGGEKIGTWLNQPDGQRRDTGLWLFANDRGEITWNWQAPADAPNGGWQAITLGEDSRVQVVLNFTISGSSGPAPQAPPNTSVTPASGLPGATFTFTADGFNVREEIAYWAIDPQGTPVVNRPKTRADQSGKATASWTAPANAAAGQWTFTFRGQNSRREVQIPFTVNASAPGETPYSVEPATGGPGTTFRFTVRGLVERQFLDAWANGPNNAVLAGTPNLRADRQGVATWEWTAPDNIAAGQWQMYVRTRNKKTIYNIPFTIVRDAPPVEQRPYSVSPASGRAGTTFSFSASGFTANEALAYWLTAPDGATVTPPGSVTELKSRPLFADREGRISWSWTAPADAQRGIWLMVIRSDPNDRTNSGTQYAIRFTVE